MEIKTKLNCGDTAYTWHEGFFRCVEIIDIEIQILRNQEPIIYYICYDHFGGNTKYEINEKFIFETGHYLKEYLCSEVDKLLKKKSL